MFGEFDDYMFRDANEALKLQVWGKGIPSKGHDRDIYLRDSCGKTIRYMDHGTHRDCGWYIDLIVPLSRGGTTDISNLQPMHWQNRLLKKMYNFWFPGMGISDGWMPDR